MKKIILKFSLIVCILLSSTSDITPNSVVRFDYAGFIRQNDKKSVSLPEKVTNVKKPSFNSNRNFDYFKDLIKDSINFDDLKEQALDFIKFHEGFTDRPTACPAGWISIGYGHVITPKDSLLPEIISVEQADSILRRDFEGSLDMAKLLSPEIGENKLIAVAHFCYAKGPGNYKTSTLRKFVNSGLNLEAVAEFRKWCKYISPTGDTITSKYCSNIREWEIRMYAIK